MAFYISGPKLLFETTEISTHPNSTQQESNYICLYTTKFGTSIKIRLNRKFESTEFETMRVNCISKEKLFFKSFPEKQFPNLTFDSLKMINSKKECIDGYMDHAYPINNGCKSKYRYLLENVAPCILVR